MVETPATTMQPVQPNNGGNNGGPGGNAGSSRPRRDSRERLERGDSGGDSSTNEVQTKRSSRGDAKDLPVRKPEDTFRDEIARQIFGEIGNIRDDYSCAVESKILLHGRMYITDKFICFYSNFFGFEKKIKIPFSHVLKITKGNTALLIPNGINVVTSRKEYCFRSFWDRDECYYQMVSSFRSYRHFANATREAIIESRSIDTDGYMETASSAVAAAAKEGGAGQGGAPSSSSSSTTTNNNQQQQQQPALTTSTSASTAFASSAASPEKGGGEVQQQKKGGSPPRKPAAARETSKDDEGNSTDAMSVGSFDEDDMLDFDDLREGTQNVVAERDLSAAFEKATSANPLKEKGIDINLKASVQEFFEEFIRDKAPSGMDKFHESEGDKEVEVSPWQEVNQGVGATRSIRFIAQLEGLPIGPPTAPVLQLQRLRVFGQYGMILETSSSMENVPAGDCFTVEDRWIIRPGTNGEGTVLQTFIDVKFNKGTFFKKIIESRSKSDTFNSHQKWVSHAERHMAKKHHEKTPPRREKPPKADAGKAKGGEGGKESENAVVRIVRRISDPAIMITTKAVKRIKWDRLLAAICVSVVLFYFIRFLYRSFLPTTSSFGGGGGGGITSFNNFDDLLKEIRALRHDIHELKAEIKSMGTSHSTLASQVQKFSDKASGSRYAFE